MEKASNIYGFAQSNSTTFNWDGSLTGDTNNIDTHLMKNMEWGAVAYLSHSKYGINKEINVSISNITGQSSGTTDGSSSTLYSHDGYLLNNNKKTTTKDISKISSTTGNVYGIYDMSGGKNECVMGNLASSSNSFSSSKAGNWSITTHPLLRYYDSYTYYSSGAEKYSRGRLGDATKEMAPTGYKGNWYQESASFIDSSYVWFYRGGGVSEKNIAGIFYFHRGNGAADGGSSSRSVLIIE